LKGTKSGRQLHYAARKRGAVIAFFAVSAYGRVPAMLNFTSALPGSNPQCRTTKVNAL